MAFKIGFTSEQPKEKAETTHVVQRIITPRKSVVSVAFLNRGMTLTYYNECFDLRCGDIVFVDGKLEGIRGRIVDINYNFKIKVSDYNRIISVANTDVHGKFYMVGSHFVTFDSLALPISKVATWYIAPQREEDDFVIGYDDTCFYLDDLKGFKVSDKIAERGHDYYMENKVVYICIDGNKGYAIVEGSCPYEVEFNYNNGEISGLVCSCFCSYYCKHEVAAMLQLRDIMGLIEKHYAVQFKESGYFAAVSKGVLFSMAIDGKDTGTFTL